MSVSRLVLGTILSLSLSTLGSTVLAEPSDSQGGEPSRHPSSSNKPLTYQNVQELFQNAITYESGNFFTNRSLNSQLQLIFGTGPIGRSSFPENEITRDTALVHILYEDFLRQQAQDPPIRTRDLDNPYDTSVGSPDYLQEP
jgi:hypothetical protein